MKGWSQCQYWTFVFVCLCTLSCGAPPISLPSPLESTAKAQGGHRPRSPLKTRLMMDDRRLGRSGLSCSDCHAVGTSNMHSLRPAPRLVYRRRGQGAGVSTRAAVTFCISRYLMRPPLADADIRILSEFVASHQLQASETNEDDGHALYQSGCRHCHEDGPAPPLLGRPFRRMDLISRIRGTLPAFHPTRLMPSFNRQILGQSQMEKLIQFLLYAAHSR